MGRLEPFAVVAVSLLDEVLLFLTIPAPKPISDAVAVAVPLTEAVDTLVTVTADTSVAIAVSSSRTVAPNVSLAVTEIHLAGTAVNASVALAPFGATR